jgi:mannose/fructose/N-acetylgalactosamine-specific phosphotransferase system component IIC
MQAPDRKVSVGLLAGATMSVIAWASQQFSGVAIPADVAIAGATIISFVIQYFVPHAGDINDPEV